MTVEEKQVFLPMKKVQYAGLEWICGGTYDDGTCYLRRRVNPETEEVWQAADVPLAKVQPIE